MNEQAAALAGVELSDEQATIVRRVVRWFRHGDGRPYLTLGGLAGTGKTFVVRHLWEELGGDAVKIMAFTGKAVSVLRSREGLPAATIHSTIYVCEPVTCSACGGLRTVPCQVCRGRREWPQFVLREPEDVIESYFIIDEASMISRDLLADLLSFQRPILFVGDHGQLEPIGDDPGLMHAPDFRLETIHRQAAGSPIIRFAHRMRAGKDPRTSDESGTNLSVRLGAVRADELIQFTGDDAQIICGYNRTRVSINGLLRKRADLVGDPIAGEKLIFLRNSKRYGVFNGMLFRPTSVYRGKKRDGQQGILWMTLRLDEKLVTVPVDAFQFENPEAKSLPPAKWVDGFPACHADFAYALTCHKSQGSEYDSVMVLDQVSPIWDMARWRYTAASRASKLLSYHVR